MLLHDAQILIQMYRTVKTTNRAAASSGFGSRGFAVLNPLISPNSSKGRELDQESEILSPKKLESRSFEASNREV